ncbi:MAG TPA: hydrogenase expression/formation protein HypE [Candidatus Omnitrophota bacterium]|nr:hydrogenase expression/formation protein HypE [Candidatus Omnitrophota bacterium]
MANNQTAKIRLAHGNGGKLMHELIGKLLVPRLSNPILAQLSDAACLPFPTRIAFTTDSFVVKPLVFNGGTIGSLSVCGTVNDLLMQGALPEYLSLSLILEEGFSVPLLEKIVDSLAHAARNAGVVIATGDFKVVEKGACDGLFINTSGVGRIISWRPYDARHIRPGDSIIITGGIAEHGFSVLSARSGLRLRFSLVSDCAALTKLLVPIIRFEKGITCMRDPTRGGIATTLNELAAAAGVGIVIDEKSIPMHPHVKAAAELLGMDPLYIASEGRALIFADAASGTRIVQKLRKHPLGRSAAIIGTVCSAHRGTVIMKTVVGTERIVDMLSGEPLPRIC